MRLRAGACHNEALLSPVVPVMLEKDWRVMGTETNRRESA